MNETQKHTWDQQIQQRIDQYLRQCLTSDYLLPKIRPQLEPSPLASSPPSWEILLGGEPPAVGQSTWQAAIETALAEVLEPLQQLIWLGGKRWRPALTLLHCLMARKTEWRGGQGGLAATASLDHLAAPVVTLIELLHNATLIADDIEDNGQLRRGIPAFHLSYGLDRALNACNWAYFLPQALLQPLEHAGYAQLAHELLGLCMQCLNQIHLGQALDIRWHHRHDYIPTPEEYFAMASLKTGVLAGFAAQAGARLGQTVVGQSLQTLGAAAYPAASLCGRLWQRVGRAFQVLDDLMNITVGNPGKLRGDDWLEGKKSMPLCMFVHGACSTAERPPQTQYLQGERRSFILGLISRAQQASAASPAQQQTELQAIRNEFTGRAQQALATSLAWLEDELANCRQLASQLYQPFFSSSCPTEFFSLLDQLAANARACRAAISE